MRQSLIWKMILVLALATGTPFSASAQQELVRRPSQAQLDRLDQIEGVGPLKFGMKLTDLPNDDLGAEPSTNNSNDGAVTYLYLKPNDITWGTLVPTRVSLQFVTGQLVHITMHFEDKLGVLVALSRAAYEKYGVLPRDEGGIPLSGKIIDLNGDFFDFRLPNNLVPGDFDEKAIIDVNIGDHALRGQLIAEQAKAAKAQYEKEQNIDKMKANM